MEKSGDGPIGKNTIDSDIIEFVSGTATSHPDALLQARLQEALDAKALADIRQNALKVCYHIIQL